MYHVNCGDFLSATPYRLTMLKDLTPRVMFKKPSLQELDKEFPYFKAF